MLNTASFHITVPMPSLHRHKSEEDTSCADIQAVCGHLTERLLVCNETNPLADLPSPIPSPIPRGTKPVCSATVGSHTSSANSMAGLGLQGSACIKANALTTELLSSKESLSLRKGFHITEVTEMQSIKCYFSIKSMHSLRKTLQ
ncbi:hypothetical protein MATL_G00248870 [Megalops atlanticus]|uniref:Uncharacterized protein n=1 Tax=Megalops atlanticus TaxID=7932 RepID=A0A9D3T0P4_MEGAT|nr:hypothetical protein MATL_G00248870 [Megalops atlanticus]